jgi:dephospho-CoA kinase
MIIGLSGYARSGKDEVAKILVEEYGYKRIAFADNIRKLLYATNPQVGGNRLQFLVEDYGWDVAKSQPEVRHLLQSLGVAARNLFGKDFWVAQALSQVHFENNWVITDVRFTNEADRIKQYDNSQVWRIKRTGVEAVNSHVSEHDMDSYQVDMILKNEGTLEDLRTLVRKRMEISLNAN